MDRGFPTRADPTLRFRAFGFPVTIHVSFLVLIAIVGFGVPMPVLGIWVVVGTLAILGHELGHALAARAMGATATISLEGLAGFTLPVRPVPFSRREDALLSAAGPAAGFLLGFLVAGVAYFVGWPSGSTGRWILALSLFSTIGWSIFNLLPIIPLDGGRLLVALLPGSETERRRRGAKVSIALCAIGAVVSYRSGLSGTSLYALLFGAQNLADLRNQDRFGRWQQVNDLYETGQHDEAVERARSAAANQRAMPDERIEARRQAVLALLATERRDEAENELDRTPESTELGKAFRGFVVAELGDVERGVALAHEAFEEDPTPSAVWWYMQALLRTGDHDRAAAFVEDHRDLISFELAEAAVGMTFHCGSYVAAGRIGDAMATLHDPAHARLAYNAACGWSRVGAERVAFASLQNAVRLGWTDFTQIDTDDDLAPLRQSADWPALRTKLAA
jgi:Zn-dependent protease